MCFSTQPSTVYYNAPQDKRPAAGAPGTTKVTPNPNNEWDQRLNGTLGNYGDMGAGFASKFTPGIFSTPDTNNFGIDSLRVSNPSDWAHAMVSGLPTIQGALSKPNLQITRPTPAAAPLTRPQIPVSSPPKSKR